MGGNDLLCHRGGRASKSLAMFPAFAFRNWFGKIKGGVAMVLAGMVPMVLSAQETQWLVDEIGPWSENLY
jgi:hypothetical protein